MARGKYSPTVSAAYAADQGWWQKYRVEGETYQAYDPEGYDSYGYNEDCIDRAGNHENDYLHNDGDYDLDEDYNDAYNDAYRSWTFDGVKPVRKM